MFPLPDEHFTKYIQNLEPILAARGRNTDALQKWQVDHLAKLEKDFRRALVRHPRGIGVYRAFIDQCANILTARPFFRERDETFKAHISTALKAKDPVALTRFSFNWNFIQFVVRLGGWEADRQGRRMLDLANRVRDMRHELVECNLPLAIREARGFFHQNQRSHLAKMDFNQIAAVGLVEAIDKFSGPYTKTFRAVCIGRMKGNLIDDNSQTYIHFYPTERKTLYRVRKLMRTLPKDGPVDYQKLHHLLNAKESSSEEKLTGFSDMLHILAASQVTSANALVSDGDEDEHTNLIDKFAAPASSRPDVQVEQAEGRRAVGDAIRTLPLVDQKLLRMRGVDL
jgi:RNA polymerase sigma factor (sigma-70 family)